MLININVKLTTANGEHIISLPQSQNEFDETLTSMHIMTGDHSEYTINNVISNLGGMNYSLGFADDIEELNLLAQILDGFFDNELKTFEAVVIHEDGVVSIRNLINIAYNLLDFDIDPSIRSFEELGTKYVNKKTPKLDLCILNNINLFGVGVDVQVLQHGEFTSAGYISNYHSGFDAPYDGQLFPEYDYDDSYILKLRLSKDNVKTGVEFTIPASENVVNRAMRRLGVSSLDECVITRYSSWNFDAITKAAWVGNDIEELNSLVKKIQKINRGEIINYLNAVKKEETLVSISILDLFTDFFLTNDFKRNDFDKNKNKNGEPSYFVYSEPFGKLKELLRTKVTR